MARWIIHPPFFFMAVLIDIKGLYAKILKQSDNVPFIFSSQLPSPARRRLGVWLSAPGTFASLKMAVLRPPGGAGILPLAKPVRQQCGSLSPGGTEIPLIGVGDAVGGG